ncbi:hypothetical protein Plhal703r1_c03g0019421 [Plasmopara halstedii]
MRSAQIAGWSNEMRFRKSEAMDLNHAAQTTLRGAMARLLKQRCSTNFSWENDGLK